MRGQPEQGIVVALTRPLTLAMRLAVDRLIDLYSAINIPQAVKKYRELREKYPLPKNVTPTPK